MNCVIIIVVGADVKKLTTPYKERTCPFFETSAGCSLGWQLPLQRASVFLEKGIP